MNNTPTSVISGRKIPKALQGVQGLSTGFITPDIQHSRLVITGQPGSGKSTLLNSNPHLLMLDPEQGGYTVADPRALRFTPPPLTKPDNLDTAYAELLDKVIRNRLAGDTSIKMIGIDSLDELIDIFLTALCLRHGVSDPIDLRDGSGNGYTLVRKSIFGLLDRAYRAGLGWAVIAHTRTKTVRVNGQDKQVSGLAVSDSFKAAVFQKCEHMLFVEHGITTVVGPDTFQVVNGKKIRKPGRRETQRVRKLKTRPGGLWQGGDTHDVKVRIPLPEEIVLPPKGGWDALTVAHDLAADSVSRE